MLRLSITDEDGRTVVVPVNQEEITIGRKDGNLIQLSERNISRYHALLTNIDEICHIDDLDSYNGIIINGQKISGKTRVMPGDLMELGDYKIRLEDVEQDRVDFSQDDILLTSDDAATPENASDPLDENISTAETMIFEAVDPDKVESRSTQQERTFEVQSAIKGDISEYDTKKTKWVLLFIVFLVLFAAGLWFLPSSRNQETAKEVVEPENTKAAPVAVVKPVEEKKVPEKLAVPETKIAQVDADEELRRELIEESVRLANIEIADEDWRSAEKILNALLADIPEADDAVKLRDKVRLEKRNHTNYKNGLRALKKRNAFQALTLLGGISKRSQYYKVAQQSYSYARQSLVRDYLKKSIVFFTRKKYSKAIDWADKVLNIDGKNKRALKIRQDSKKKLAEESAGKNVLTPKSYYNIATDYYNKRQYGEAFKNFKKVLKMDPGFAYAWRGLGACYARASKMNKAMRAYQKYIELMPNAPDKAEVVGIIKEYQDKQ